MPDWWMPTNRAFFLFMADASVVKIRIDSKEYDQELRKVTAGLTNFFEKARAGGASLDELEKGAMEAVQAFGRMDTAANSARGKASELTRAFTELHVQYQQMTDAEKSSPLGKEMSKSLEELRQRLENNRTQLDNATAALHGTESAGGSAAGVMEQLAQKFTVNIDAIKLFSMGLAAAKGALDVAKDAFFNNEEQLDEWGRIVESSHSLYQGFLNSLNTGDISGFLKNMGSIVQAARDAYDALDALGTYNAFNQINVEKTRTGMTESIADYRMGQGSKEDVKAAGEAYKNELKERKRLERDAYLAAVKEMAAQRGVSEKDLLDAMSGSYGHYQELKDENKNPLTGTATRYTPGLLPGTQGTYTQYKVAQNDRERLGEALRHLNDTELKSLQALGAQAERTGNEIAQVDRSLARVLNGNRVPGGGVTGGTRGGTARNGGAVLPTPGMDVGGLVFNGYDTTQSMNEMQAMLQTYQKALKDATTQAEYEAATEGIARMKELIEAQPIALKMGVSAETVVSWREEAQKRMDEIEPIKIGLVVDQQGNNPLNSGKKLAEEWKDVAGAIQAVGSAMNQIEDPAAKVLGTIAQAIATVALTFSKSLSGTVTPWDWIAAAAAGTATMISTINAIKTATAGSYAEGGIVPGNNYSDGLIAHVSSGELILNKAQQNSIASQLTQGNGDGEGLSAHPYVSGEMIFLGVNNYLRRMGRGEIVTTR